MLKITFKFILVLLFILPNPLSGQDPYIIVLGITQDGGYPHMGCTKECCKMAWENPSMRRNVVSLALVDPVSQQWYLFEATPDIKEQLHMFHQLTADEYNYLPRAVFVSHAHIGHYTGLMQFGREVMNTSGITVYVLPRMNYFINNNGPWDQLVRLGNIVTVEIPDGSEIALSEKINIKVFTVPHRDEYSETAGYKISTGIKGYLFIPDIDKWEKWDKNINEMVKSVDIAFLDGTFYSEGELQGRNMENIPHPFITETMNYFASEDSKTKKKIHFIHFNHSNPVLFKEEVREFIRSEGFELSEQGKKY
ncbi:MAG: hypothetical protein JW965_03555 [Bacteroidales bacterium]|nr:hypothetical protein [Bacteroidales bacterium]